MAVNSFNAQNPPVNTKGDLFTFSTIPTKLGVGSNNQVLTADSTTATGLKWATASSGGMTLISTINASAATSVSFTSIPTTYKQLLVTWIDVYMSSATQEVIVRLNNSSASVYTYSAYGVRNDASQVLGDREGNSFRWVIFNTGTAATPLRALGSGSFLIKDPDIVGNHSVEYVSGCSSDIDATNWISAAGTFYPATAAAVTRIDFIRGGAQTITGTFKLWGIS